jgi:hypothetical protein
MITKETVFGLGVLLFLYQVVIQLVTRRRHWLLGVLLGIGIPATFVWLFSLRQYFSETRNGWELIGAFFLSFGVLILGMLSLLVRFVPRKCKGLSKQATIENDREGTQ